ncbi:MAG TPA: c-type cytochrome [Deltaproteobacteria bacterium]|nr:c-type cytochrome [Deltaproteobacteria bacterium]
MLSKSQARLFYVTATVGFSGVFLLLTADTLRQVPQRSNAAQLTEAVVHGKDLWDENNCMGCHTLLGEGAYYAPELTKVVERRGAQWIKIFLRDPEAMFPGRRRMVRYDLSDEEIDALVAFFTWIGGIDTNGFPAEPDLAPAGAAPITASAVAPDAPEVFGAVCTACHSLGGSGGAVGPALDDVSERYDAASLRRWLADPLKVKPDTTMPNLQLSDADLDALTAFLLADR